MTARIPRARKRKTIVEEEIPDGVSGADDPLNELDISLEGVEDTETLKDVLEQFGQTANVLYRIYRQVPTGPPSFCYETTAYDEVFLQRERGAGVYTVRIFINGKFKKSIPVQVDAPTTGTAPNPTPGDSHAQFLEKLLMIMITQQGAGGHAATPSILDLTTALANLDGLRGKQESAMDMFMKGVELAKTLNSDNGPGDWKTELLKMGREALPGITSIVQAKMGPTPPVQEPAKPGEQTMIDPNQLTDEQKNQMLRQVIQYLKGQFIAGLDPESALNFIVANSGNPQYQAVIKAVLNTPFETIVSLDAELRSEPFHSCFRSVYDGLRSEFSTVDPVESDTRGDSGDDDNTGDHVPTGKTRTN